VLLNTSIVAEFFVFSRAILAWAYRCITWPWTLWNDVLEVKSFIFTAGVATVVLGLWSASWSI